jgi:hypothetical protein
VTTPILPPTGTGDSTSRALTVCRCKPHSIANLVPTMEAAQVIVLINSIMANDLANEIVLFESGRQPQFGNTICWCKRITGEVL